MKTKTTQIKEGVMLVERFAPNGKPTRFDTLRSKKGYQFFDQKTQLFRRFAHIPHGTDLSNLIVLKDGYGII